MQSDKKRREQLRALLLRERDQLENRVKDFRRDQAAEALAVPGDEMDRAKSLLDVETHASLIARAEDQLVQIDGALQRVEDKSYGICVSCGEEISLARLEALPFTPYCVDCKSSLGDSELGGSPQAFSRTEREAYRRWTPPPEADESAALVDDDGNAADELNVIGGDDSEVESDPENGGQAGSRRRRRKS